MNSKFRVEGEDNEEEEQRLYLTNHGTWIMMLTVLLSLSYV